MEFRASNYSNNISAKAQKEIYSAWEWYEERQKGLGDRFLSDVINTIKRIEAHPERYVNRISDFREAQLKIFPYLIIYKIDKTQKAVRILSVFHTARSIAGKYKA